MDDELGIMGFGMGRVDMGDKRETVRCARMGRPSTRPSVVMGATRRAPRPFYKSVSLIGAVKGLCVWS